MKAVVTSDQLKKAGAQSSATRSSCHTMSSRVEWELRAVAKRLGYRSAEEFRQYIDKQKEYQRHGH